MLKSSSMQAGWLIKNKTLQRYEMMLEFSVAQKIKTNQLFILPRCFELFLEHKIVKNIHVYRTI